MGNVDDLKIQKAQMNTKQAKEREDMERKIKQARDAEERQKKQQNLQKAQQAMYEGNLDLKQLNDELEALLNEIDYSEERDIKRKGKHYGKNN